MGRYQYLIFSALILAFVACNQHKTTNAANDSDKDSAGVLEGREAIRHMELEDGLEVQLVAQEPMVVAPVAMTFDFSGRMWVVEMTGFMPDTSGTGEDIANGKIVVLEDKNGDGEADERHVFLDSLVLPRAICLVDSGILVATPPQLWYYEIQGNKAGKRTLVDDHYADGGNVEHQPNGLLRSMDNWIYNAKSDSRYRKVHGKWIKERTQFRGQWGISQDDEGRLFYNNNSQNLLGDYFLPGLPGKNTHQREAAGFDEKVVSDNNVYPARKNLGVNRGYVKGVLNEEGKLISFTAACGPHIYRGELLPRKYYGGAFVAEPAANLVKWNILRDSGDVVTGEQAYKGKEFLASADERFRPTNLITGTDGALYITDMYRGIIQHKTYLTPYLKQQIAARKLTLPLNCGRIYRIVPKGSHPALLNTATSTSAMLTLLHHKNGIIRDMAQQQLVDQGVKAAVPLLRLSLHDTTQPLTQRHALWTLEGLEALTLDDVRYLLDSGTVKLKIQAMAALPSLYNKNNSKTVTGIIDSLLHQPATARHAAWLLPAVGKWDKGAVAMMEQYILTHYAADRYISAALVNNAQGRERALLEQLQAMHKDTTISLYKVLQETMEDMQSAEEKQKMAALELSYPRGYEIFNNICQTCHGKNGNGIASMAPPLNESNWVNGDKKKLAAIVLYGLTGPVAVHGKVYQSPEISGDMPGIGSSDEYSDADIAQVLSYLRAAWKNKAGQVTESDIKAVRKQYNGRQKPFTASELQ
ncbi:Glucose/arabinose dehydrogenase, beta-propeller fold [Chitinophaga jiangningensis]|uniref:Glucose/arabinose dehydrogenase, beta-propeller fold n=1 Tax=Chitinophaga jiangningensis TaxID=1419482 RepID=A0A1M7M5F0_9BACT|nr:c-type cytochrome [Chitinophaga jiangningensis]SHM85934.1 Glucose/arabinose dehydrogenase, beta-propeller fold [Chitinophaga jiangningensis]